MANNNPTILPVSTILQCGALGLSYAIKDISQKNAFQGGALNWDIPQKIYLVYKSVKHRFDGYPSDPSLRDTSNLLWRLLGVYGMRALNHLQGGGNVVINGGGGLVLIPFSEPFVIGTSYPSAATSVTLNWRSFGTQSSNIEVVLQNATVNPLLTATAGDFTYDVTFNATTTTISFQQNGVPTAPEDGQIMLISGFKYT